MTGFLASVSNLHEAEIVLAAGADIVDLKDPANGALGALSPQTIAHIVRSLGGRVTISATTGDLPAEPAVLSHAVEATAATGVDIVKVGLFGRDHHARCIAAMSEHAGRGVRLVAVMFADQQPDLALIDELSSAGFAGVMLDTADKAGGDLRKQLNDETLRSFISRAHKHDLLAGLAGSLRTQDIPHLLALDPDYLGFRTALCKLSRRNGGIDREAAALVRACIPSTAQARESVTTSVNGDASSPVFPNRA
ncbi:MAG: (5-formylfuran-3-yl)methyl phosphate synthase [Gammaproteobacteria bacterium]